MNAPLPGNETDFNTRLIEGSRDCIKVLDLEGRLLSMNAGGMEALEICDLAPVLGSSWIEFWQGADREAASAAVESARRGGVGRFVGYFPTTQTHRPKWWDVVVSALCGAGGRPEKLLAVSRDVTDLKRAQDLLRAVIEGTAGVTGRDFFRSLVRHLAVGLRVRFAFVAECLPQLRARSLAFMVDGQIAEAFEYELPGTPCMEVARGRTCHVPDRLAEVFPEDKAMIGMGTVSYLGVPLLNSDKRVIGHLVIFDDKPMPADSLALSVMETFAARAGAELEREQAAERLEQASERRRTLLEITNAIIKHLKQEDLLRATCEALRRVMPFDRAAFLLYQPETDGLRILAIEGKFHSDRFRVGMEIPRRDSHSGWAFDHQRPLLRRDLEKEQQFGSERLLYAEGVRSICTAPLIVGGKSIGTMNLASNTPMQYSEGHAELLQEVANQLAVAVSNMRAFEDVHRLSSERQALLDVNRAISRHLERDELFGALAACLRNLLEIDCFGIELPIEGNRLQGHLLTPTGGGPMRTRVKVLAAEGTACNWVLQHREWLVTPTREELRERFPSTHETMSKEGMESLCALPLTNAGRAGAVLFFMAARRAAYGHLPRALLEQVAGAVAVAIDDCLAHEEVRQLRDRLAAENAYLQEEIRSEHNFDEIVGNSPALLEVLRQVDPVARTDSTVLLLGETGTGKELIARAIHDRSARKGRPLVKVNCGAISAGLVESELFGHVKGAFTGALAPRDGRFKVADGGTLFLDEVGELPLETQVKLLRVLQEQEFEPLGSSKTVKVNVRLIAATNRDLAAAVSAGNFRSDLFYRLNVLPLWVPPLRERAGDVPLLVTFFLRRFAKQFGRPVKKVSEETMRQLTSYAWPGNIRELQNVIERAVVLATGSVLRLASDFQPVATAPGESAGRSDRWLPPGRVEDEIGGSRAFVGRAGWPAPAAGASRSLDEVERRHIESVLRQTNWLIEGERGAAKILSLHPSTLRSRMQKLGIQRPAR